MPSDLPPAYDEAQHRAAIRTLARSADSAARAAALFLIEFRDEQVAHFAARALAAEERARIAEMHANALARAASHVSEQLPKWTRFQRKGADATRLVSDAELLNTFEAERAAHPKRNKTGNVRATARRFTNPKTGKALGVDRVWKALRGARSTSIPLSSSGG